MIEKLTTYIDQKAGDARDFTKEEYVEIMQGVSGHCNTSAAATQEEIDAAEKPEAVEPEGEQFISPDTLNL